MDNEERYCKLIELKELLQSKQINFNNITNYELYFLGVKTTGCKCKIKKVIKKLNKFLTTIGNKEIIDYETENKK